MWLKQLKKTDSNQKDAIYFLADESACKKLIADGFCKELDGPNYPEEGVVISSPEAPATFNIRPNVS